MFDYVIIDEATQATEISSLIPLIFNPKKVIFVGDPDQLPPTTFNQFASQIKSNKSLYEKMKDNGYPEMKLKT